MKRLKVLCSVFVLIFSASLLTGCSAKVESIEIVNNSVSTNLVYGEDLDLNQLQIVDFYEKYKYAILYLCSRSNFSLRKPVKVAQYFYYRDKLHANLLGKKRESVELYFNEYENLKSYFSYQKYSNIYKFYEDYRYQRAENILWAADVNR